MNEFPPIEGCDRCDCGCKYWEDGKCIDCGERFRPVVISVRAPKGVTRVVFPGRSVTTVLDAMQTVAGTHGGDVRRSEAGKHFVVFSHVDDAQQFVDDVHETWARLLTAEEVV